MSTNFVESFTKDPFYRNAFAIGRNHLGEALAVSRPCLNFDCHPRLTDVGRTGLRNLLAGVRAIRELDLANVNLQDDQEVDELISAMTSAKAPNLQVLGLSRCHLNQKSTRAIGALLQMSPLKRLDLEGNTAFLVSNDAVEGLTEAVGSVGLQSLDVLSLRWCHIQPLYQLRWKTFCTHAVAEAWSLIFREIVDCQRTCSRISRCWRVASWGAPGGPVSFLTRRDNTW